MNVLTVCSGIGAPEVAWRDFGWNIVAGADIEPFPNAVRAHHFPDVPNWGDMTKFAEWPDAAIDLLVGGTPCQSFSVAGLRKGLADPRGNLALTFLAIAAKYAPRWILWENVPGVLSSDGGRDFGAFLGGLGQLGYGWAYRVLDAQYFGVAQRRRRVFVVGYAGDWRSAAAVLFERHSLQGHPAPRRQAGERVAPILEAGARTGVSTTDERAGSGIGEAGDPMFTLQAGKQHAVASTGDVSHCLNAGGMGRQDYETETLIAFAGMAQGGAGWAPPSCPTLVDCSLPLDTKRAQAIAFSAKDHGADAIPLDIRQTSRGATLTNSGRSDNPLSGSPGLGVGNEGDPAHTLGQSAGGVFTTSAVRRLTPRECERLQGFPDDYTLVPYRGKPAADGPRYKALGNSMAVPVMRWIGERIAQVEALSNELRRAA